MFQIADDCVPTSNPHARRLADGATHRIDMRVNSARKTLRIAVAAVMTTAAVTACSGTKRPAESPTAGVSAPGDESTATPPPMFTESAEDRGISGHHAPFRLLMSPSMNGGAAMADIDDDGDLDLYLTRYNQPNTVLFNDGTGHFQSPTAPIGLEVQGASGTPLFADVDGDGDIDAFVTPTNYGRPYLLINDSGTFADETDARGISLQRRELAGETGSFAYGARFVDIDHDSDLDLFVGEWGMLESVHHRRDIHRSYLFRNDSTGHFTEDAGPSGLGSLSDSAVFGFSDLDVDGDGWEDLLVSGDFGSTRVFRSQLGKRFVDITSQVLPPPTIGSGSAGGTPSEATQSEMVYNAMGSTLADLNNDGALDWIVSAIGPDPSTGSDQTACLNGIESTNGSDAGLIIRCTGNRAYSFAARGQARDLAPSAGVTDSGWSWGVVAADLDVDGRMDLAITNGYVADYQPDVVPPSVVVNGTKRAATDLPIYDAAQSDMNRLWLSNSADSPSSALTEGAGNNGFGSTDQGRALVGGDIDRDGDVDIVQVNNGAQAPELFINSANPSADRWVGVQVDPGTDGPPDCVGCIVRVTAEGSTQVRKISGSGSYASGDPHEVEFGFAAPIDSIDVTVEVPGGAPIAATVRPGSFARITR